MGSLRTYFSRCVLPALAASAVSLSAIFPVQVLGEGRFDLTGPSIDVHVQRGDKSLPIAMVPNLQPGDRLTIHADLPSSQSVKLILVVAFLRGSTNPPTDRFFSKVDTWDKKVRSEGMTVVVPDEAQQALIFLAPETGGDYSTLKSAVQGRPGVFVRAAQDLNEASFEQARIERYIQAIRRVPPESTAQLLDHSRKLAATLNLKPNDDCFKRPLEQQSSCLRQTGNQLLLDDGHGQTLASMMTSGDSANLIGAVAGTPMASAGGAGVYSAYVGTVIDLVRLMSGLHTAHYQYIPAIAFPSNESLNLRLNTPPSFHNPKSVIVVALPAIQPSIAPPLRLQDPSHVSCLLQPAMVLPLEGAPLVFATGFAHDLVLHLNGGTIDGKTDLPLVPDAYEGGLVLASVSGRRPLATSAPETQDNKALAPQSESPIESDHSFSDPAAGETTITGTLRGAWGFDAFEGVTVPLQRRTVSDWTVAPQDELIAGKSNQLQLHANGTACVSDIDLRSHGDEERKLTWKPAPVKDRAAATAITVKLPLEKISPGNAALQVHQYGTQAVANVAFTAYADQPKLTGLRVHAGDTAITLMGDGLGQVAAIRIGARDYTPSSTSEIDGKQLRFTDKVAGQTDKERGKSPFIAGSSGTATVQLRDGRTQSVNFNVDAARPSLELLSHSVKPGTQTGLPLTAVNTHDLPLDSTLTFAIQSATPNRFTRTESVEVALADGSLHTRLTFADGSLVLQDARTALAFLSPMKAFGASAYGDLQMRPVLGDGTTGDWVPLGILVRLPQLTSFTCVKSPSHVASAVAATRSTSAQAAAAGAHSLPTSVPPQAEAASVPVVNPGCTVSGSSLFLIDSVAADSSFTSPVEVPLGFTGEMLQVPRPADGHTLYLHLRDDPNAVFSTTLPSVASTSKVHPPASAATDPL